MKKISLIFIGLFLFMFLSFVSADIKVGSINSTISGVNIIPIINPISNGSSLSGVCLSNGTNCPPSSSVSLTNVAFVNNSNNWTNINTYNYTSNWTVRNRDGGLTEYWVNPTRETDYGGGLAGDAGLTGVHTTLVSSNISISGSQNYLVDSILDLKGGSPYNMIANLDPTGNRIGCLIYGVRTSGQAFFQSCNSEVRIEGNGGGLATIDAGTVKASNYYDSAGNFAMDADNGFLIDVTGYNSIDFRNRLLLDSNGVQSQDYSNRILNGGWSTDSLFSPNSISTNSITATTFTGTDLTITGSTGTYIATKNVSTQNLTISNEWITGGNAPTLAANCGTGAVISGNDKAGNITTGTGVVTDCTIKFSHTLKNSPHCVANDRSSSVSAEIPNMFPQNITIHFFATYASGGADYICVE